MLTSQGSFRIAIVCCCAATLAACAKKDETPVDTSTAVSASTTQVTPAPAPTPVNLADVAGKWDVSSVPVSGDTTTTHYVLGATAATSGWTITFPGRKPVPVKVSTDADSITMDAGPFSSVRRKGVQVTTHTVSRLQGGNLVGTTVAHYAVKTADSVLTLNTTATKAK